MRIQQFLSEDAIDLYFYVDPPEREEDEEGPLSGGRLWRHKETVLRRIVELFETSGQVGNANKLHRDIVNRERQATTALGKGVAIPHVRTLQAKRIMMAVGLSREGIEFDAIDGQPVHLFMAMVAPPYDDKTYLKIYRAIGEMVTSEGNLKEIFEDFAYAGEAIRWLGRWLR